MNIKIYKISSILGKCAYIGKTVKPTLNQRLSQHKYDATHDRGCSSSILFQYQDYKIELMEENVPVPLVSQTESYYINNTENCINKYKKSRVNI